VAWGGVDDIDLVVEVVVEAVLSGVFGEGWGYVEG
jgi:hypothetical protein